MFSSSVCNSCWPQAEEFTQVTGKRSLYHLLDPPYTSSQFASTVGSFRRGLDREKQKRKTAEGRQTKQRHHLHRTWKLESVPHSVTLMFYHKFHYIQSWPETWASLPQLQVMTTLSWLDHYARMSILCHRPACFPTVPRYHWIFLLGFLPLKVAVLHPHMMTHV